MTNHLTTDEFAVRARTNPSTVRYWRHIGYGPPSFKVGRRVLYAEDDVDGWLGRLRADALHGRPTAGATE